jgi:hypothetical protein
MRAILGSCEGSGPGTESLRWLADDIMPIDPIGSMAEDQRLALAVASSECKYMGRIG